MALQTLEGDLIPMRPAKEPLTRAMLCCCWSSHLSFGLFNVHSQSGVTEGGVLGYAAAASLVRHFAGR